MAPFRRWRWADLPPDLLICIGDRLDLKWYASARGACTAWRCALAPPSPALLVVADDGGRWCPSAASLPTRRSFDLTAIVSGSRCVGSSNGWLALSVVLYGSQTIFVLLNPVTAVEIVLPPLIYESRLVSKVVFTPSPAKDDFAAAAICDIDRIAYITAGARRWAIMDPVRLASGDQLTDVVYHDKGGKVFCLTSCGDVHVLRLPERRRRKPANADEAGPSEPEFSVLLPECRRRRKPANADEPGPSEPEFCVLRAPPGVAADRALMSDRARRWQQLNRNSRMRITSCADESSFISSRRVVPPESQGPDLNAPATVEPLGNLPFNPATAFAPPYDTVSALTSAKNLVFCEGNLYQVWRNASCTVTLQLPGGGQRRVAEDEILVLRYYPRRQPCWDVVKDLGGYSLFVGRNNAVSMYAEGVPGLKGNCVYWIGGRGRDQGMVFDMETERSTQCRPPRVGTVPGYLHRTICWYFLSDVVNNRSTITNNTGGRRVYQTRARARADLT